MRHAAATDAPDTTRSDTGALLVTGISHPLARRVAAHAAADGAGRVVFVLARPDEAELAHRLALEVPEGARIEVLEGDPASIDLGLSGPEYLSVARRIVRVHHVAHSADTSLDAATLTDLNCACAAEAIELARTSGRARLVFHSSVHAAPVEHGVAVERPCQRDDATHDPLTGARRRAEALAWRASSDVPVVVLRTGGVVPDPIRDRPLPAVATNPNLLGLLLVLAQDKEVGGARGAPFAALARSLRAAPLHLAPVDFVARACLRLGAHHDTIGAALNVVSPRAETAGDVAARLRERLGPTRKLTLARALLAPKVLESLARAPRAFVERLAAPPRVDAHRASTLLAAEGLAWPSAEGYVDALHLLLEAELGPSRPESTAESSLHE